MLSARSRCEGGDHVVDSDPAPFDRVGELVEHIEIVPLRRQPRGDLGPTFGRGRRMVDFGARLARPRPAGPHLVPFDGAADAVLVVQPAELTKSRLLADFPFGALDELEHRDVETLVPGP